MQQPTTLRTYTKKEKNMYLIGMTGQNIIYNIFNVLLSSYYLQNVLYIPAITVSTIITLARVWDAFNDPIMGTIVDRTRSKWGKCKPYLMVIPIPIGIITILNFVNYTFDVNAGTFTGRNAFIVIWAAFIYVMFGMSYTVGDIPLWSVTALMTEDEKDRQKLISLARICGGIGGGIALLALQPLALSVGQSLESRFEDAHTAEQYGFIVVAVIATLISVLMFQMAGLGIKERITPSEKTYTVKQNFQLMWRNKPFRQILLSGILGSPRSVMMIVAMPLVTYYYASKDPLMALLYIAFLGGGLFIGQFVATAFVPKLLEKHSKKNLYNYANLLVVIPNIILFFVYRSAPDKMVEPIYMVISFLVFVINGVSLGITMVIQTYMVADAVDYEEYTNGIRPDGVFFSGLTFLAKISSGIAQIIYGIACTAVGFSDVNIKAIDEFVAKSDVLLREAMMTTHPQFLSFMTMLFFIITIPSAIGGLLAVIPTWNYALDDKTHKSILEELNRRRHENDAAEINAEP